VLVSLVRRKLKDDDDSSVSGGTGFTLSDLRALHKSGQMSDQEFDAAKGRLVASAKRATERDSGAVAGQRQPRPASAVEAKPVPPQDAEGPSSPG
jgi:hypothetical protein